MFSSVLRASTLDGGIHSAKEDTKREGGRGERGGGGRERRREKGRERETGERGEKREGDRRERGKERDERGEGEADSKVAFSCSCIQQ